MTKIASTSEVQTTREPLAVGAQLRVRCKRVGFTQALRVRQQATTRSATARLQAVRHCLSAKGAKRASEVLAADAEFVIVERGNI